MKVLSLIACTTLLVAGCNLPPKMAAPMWPEQGVPANEPIAVSLFPSDQAVMGDEAVAKILASRLELPANARVALLRFPQDARGTHYRWDYWRDEEYVKLQQAHIDLLTARVGAAENVRAVMPLPSLLTPSKASIPVLREAAVRMQADLLLVFRVTSETYSQYRTFAKDRVKSYSTCEFVLLDVRTGLVPFARVVSRDRLELKQEGDVDLGETRRRAEQAAASEALSAAAEQFVEFLKRGPLKNAG